ncbi:hydrolase [Pontibacillus litoralis JSM 072002]|uniref:Hydrolase n=1 Tax=Pontibacillus litoralis JSM 072002 TaxID=1385512 RepID=A0A0A5HX10_9BACI|nr:hydrolase [Pontibacillus litoralis JSM 072002]
MIDVLNQANLIIFDLDGTLYEDTAHFDLFATKLQTELPKNVQDAFSKDYELMKKGQHPVTVGKVYNVHDDTLWTWNPFTEQLSHPQAWDGTILYKHTEQQFPAQKFDLDKWVSIGDGWWPSYVIALHHGLTMKQCHEVYNETKEDMAKQEGWLTKTPGLITYLHFLKTKKKLVLMTNSDEQDTVRLLQRLGLANMFDTIIPSAVKPNHTKQHYTELMNKYNANPEKVVSVGDNFMNEVAPALQLGMHAIWLTADVSPQTHDNLWPVQSLTEMMPSWVLR